MKARPLDISRPACDLRQSCGYTEGPISGCYDWHTHPHHQVMYAFSGSLTVEAEGQRWQVPPQRAVWIAAGTRHRTTVLRAVTGSVFLACRLLRQKSAPVLVFAAPPLLVEMVGYALRWPPQSSFGSSPLRNHFFATFAHLLPEWFAQPILLSLPAPGDPQLAAAFEYLHRHLDRATLPRAAAAAHMSARTFRRQVLEQTGLRWRDYVTRARLLAAMDLLLKRPREPVTNIALAVGFRSPSAFTEAFHRFALLTPSEYRRQGLRGRSEGSSPR